MVSQGDLLHGDANGVTSIPISIAAAVADISDAFIDAEKIVMDYVKGPGKKNVTEYAARRKEFSAQVAKLTKQAQGSK